MNEMLENGCAGIMPGCSFVEIYRQIYDAFRQGRVEEAKRIHGSLCKYVLTWMSHCEYLIQIEKTILMRRNIISSDYCRAPGYDLSDNDYKRIELFFL